MTVAGKRSPLLRAQEPPSETSPLLAASLSGDDTCATSERDFEASAADPSSDAFVESVQSQTELAAWATEAKVLASTSSTMAVTFFLQFSINFMSIFAAGRLGKLELGAAALGNMTVAVTCLAPFIGFTTSLDTLCSQAYGDGRKHLVGLHCQRMVLMLSCLSVPVALLWWNSQPIFERVIPNIEAATLTAQYMRVMIWSIPGTIIYEAGKRLLQAQGLFRQTTYVLFIVAPLNVIANYAFVFYFDLGFIGAPMAVALSRNLLAVCLVLYVKYVNGYQCWGGFSSRAWQNWGPMSWLALPGMIMVLAEWGAFEIMTFLAARFGDDYLAAQSTLVTSSGISFQIPFAMSVASSTRIANLIGAGLVDRARIAAKVTSIAFLIVGSIICLLYVSLRFYIPLIFTDDETVVGIVAVVMPIVGGMQVVDALATAAHGILRGIGKQAIGGPANLVAYYCIGFPIALTLMYKADWKLEALWTGIAIAMTFLAIFEASFIMWTDWDVASEEARKRNMAN